MNSEEQPLLSNDADADPEAADAVDVPIPKERVNRHCTDICCFLVFLVVIGWFTEVYQFAKTNGDIRKLSHGVDFNGNICGVDDIVTDSPYLYWCPMYLRTSLDFSHPICVKACPFDSTTHTRCYQGRNVTNGPIDNATGSFTQNIKYTYVNKADYATSKLGGRYCQPQSPGLMVAMSSAISGDSISKWFTWVSMIKDAWLILSCNIAVGCILGLFFIKILENHARCLLYVNFTLAGAIPLLVGVRMLRGALDPNGRSALSLGNENFEIALGSVLALCGTVILIYICCSRRTIEMACACIKVACECIADSPSLMFAPFVDLAFKLAVLVPMIYLFLLLLATGDIVKSDITQSVPGGVARSFTYTDNEKLYIAAAIFGFLWFWEFLSALSIFANAYALQRWYFTEYDETGEKKGLLCLPTVWGYLVAIRFHLGSIAMGSFIIPPARIVCWIVDIFALVLSGQNCIARFFAGIMCYLAWMVETFLRYLTGSAFVFVAVESMPFCTAAVYGFGVLMSEKELFIATSGTMWMFSLLGVLGISSLGIGCMWLMIAYVPTFRDPSSPNFVEDQTVLLIIGAFLNAGVVMSFVSQIGELARCIIVCYAIDKKTGKDADGGPKNYAPKALQYLCQEIADNKEEDAVSGAEAASSTEAASGAADLPKEPAQGGDDPVASGSQNGDADV